jgi:hypothetical protein
MPDTIPELSRRVKHILGSPRYVRRRWEDEPDERTLAYEYSYKDYPHGISLDSLYGTSEPLPVSPPRTDHDIWYMPELMTWGDYIGDPVRRANYNVFLEKFGNIKGVHQITTFGFDGVVIHHDALLLHDEIRECLSDLYDYAAIDDEAVGEVEYELRQEAEPGVVSDICFRAEQRYRYRSDERYAKFEDEAPDDECIIQWIDWLARDGRVEWIFETATSAYLDVDQVLDKLEQLFSTLLGGRR